jgi:Zn-dependent protease
MLSLLAFLYLQCFRPALTAPLPNITALDTEVAPPWVDDPSGRGTWNLLYSCGFTLVLCVWTSIHLNVPPWVVIALFAPEVVVLTAFQQWLTATCFLKELNRIAEAMPYKKSDVSSIHSY